jgi:uncharacterized protein with beta-barrel porin domain
MELYTRQPDHYRQTNNTAIGMNFCAVVRSVVALTILIFCLLATKNSNAATYAPEVRTVGVFELRFYSGAQSDSNYVPNDTSVAFSNQPWTTEQIDAVIRGIEYWKELVNTSFMPPDQKIVINIVNNSQTGSASGESYPNTEAFAEIINHKKDANGNYRRPSSSYPDAASRPADARLAYNIDGSSDSRAILEATIRAMGQVLGVTIQNANGMPFATEAELLQLVNATNLGYVINTSKAFGKTYSSAGTENGIGYSSEFIFGIGAHVYTSDLTLSQNANISSRGFEGVGIRIDGSNNTINIGKSIDIEATGEGGIGLYVASGNGNILINSGNIYATHETGIGVNLRSGSGVSRFDISGTITGSKQAIYIAESATLSTINILKDVGSVNSAAIYGDIKTDSSSTTDINFGNDTNATPDPAFNFTLNNNLIGGTQFNLNLLAGKTTIGKDAHANVNNVTVNQNAQLNIASNYKHDNADKLTVSTFNLNANAILGINTAYSAGDDIAYLNAGSATIHDDARIDITSFKKGSFSILKTTGTLTADETELGSNILVAGQTPTDRHQINLTKSGNNELRLALDATNAELKWAGGNGIWNNGLKSGGGYYWLDTITQDNEVFIDGDSVKFDTGSGTIDVPVRVDANDITFANSAKYSFTGDGVVSATGNFKINHAGTEARFAQDVEAGNLSIDHGLLGLAPNKVMTVKGNADFNDATLVIGTGTEAASSGRIEVAGKAKVSGGTIFLYGEQRRGIAYLFLSADELEIDSERGGFVLGATTEGRRGVVDYKDGVNGKYWVTIEGAVVDHMQMAKTHNQRQLAQYLNTISPQVNEFNDMNEVLMAYENLSENSESRSHFAMDETVGNIYATSGSASIQNTTIANRTIATYLRRPPLSEVVPCYICKGACVHVQKKPTSWLTVVGMGGSTQSDFNGHAYSQSSGGSVFGIDFMRRSGCHFGFYGSAMENVLTSKDIREHSRSHEFMGGFYFRADNSIGYILLNNGYGFNQYKTDRTMTEFGYRQARSSHNSFNSTVYTELGTYYLDPIFKWQGYVAFQYAGVYQSAFQENGADALNLIGDATSTTSLRGFLGFRTEKFERIFMGGLISGDFNFAWMHEYMGRTCTEFTGKFAGSPDQSAKFSVRGTNTGRDWAIFGASLGYDMGRTRFFGGYDAYLSGLQSLHTGTLGIVYVW